MAESSQRIPGKGKDRTQPTAKGCSCKRSQCIKNYCDCYQSMTACTESCRCIACRNTEERMAVDPRIPSNVRKKHRANAARDSSNSPVPSVSNASMPVAPINIIRMAPDSFNVVLQQVATEQLMPPEATGTDGDPQLPEAEAEVVEPPDAESHDPRNLFVRPINEAQLMCSLIQGSEAEQVGLEHYEVGRIAILEFAKCYKEVCEKILSLP